jgi:hypothetical protein
MKAAVFWDVVSCTLCVRNGGTSVYTILHGATSQKTAVFIVTTVKTSNLTTFELVVLLRSRDAVSPEGWCVMPPESLDLKWRRQSQDRCQCFPCINC